MKRFDPLTVVGVIALAVALAAAGPLLAQAQADPPGTTTTVAADEAPTTTTEPPGETTAPPTTTIPPATPTTTAAPTTTAPVVESTVPAETTAPAVETSVAPETTVAAPPIIAIELTNSAGGETEGDRGVIAPGNSFAYRFVPSCSGGGQDCVDVTITDTFPAEVVVDEPSIPDDVDGFRDVTWDPETSTLTVVYVQPLANPAGGTGLVAGGSDDFTITVSLPTDTTVPTGGVLANEATISAANAVAPPPDPTSVVVTIPPVDTEPVPTSDPPATSDPAPTTAPPAESTEAAPPSDITETTDLGVVIQQQQPDPTGTVAIDKTNTADGEPPGDDTVAEPGDSYTYNILASCSSINVDCVDFTVTDTFPADVVVDESTIPASIPGFREVTYDPAAQTLTVVYIQPLANPPGETGLIAGQSDSFIVSVTLPADTPLVTGDEIENEAFVTSFDQAGNPISAGDPSNVTVNVPRTVDVETSKSFDPLTAIAGDPDAMPSISISADNLSSSSAEVTEMVIEDSTAETFEYLNFVSATVTEYPAGANQAQLFVCPSANAPCDSDDDYVAGGTGEPPGPDTLDLPPTVAAADVVGVRVVFTAPLVGSIEQGATGAVEIQTDLRDTVRSTGQPIVQIPETTVIDNLATSTVTDPEADPTTASDDATAQFQILPPTLLLDPTKSFFADENGNYTTNSGEHAVIGENSGVSMLMNATNASAFPIAEIVITEPSPEVPSEFDKFNATSIRLTFPAGAANANVVITYDDGTTFEDDFAPPGPTDVTIDDDPDAAPRVTSITVTYTGPDDDGDGEPDPAIEPDATAGLGVHGNLNDGVDATDVDDGIDNCANFVGSGGGVPGTTGTFEGDACTNLDIESRSAGAGGTKTASQATIPPDQPVVFRMSTTNTGNLPLFDVVVSDPVPNADGTPPLTPTFENLRFLDAQIDNETVDAAIAIEVFIPGQGWVPLVDASPAERVLVVGVRATTDVMTPTESFDLLVEMQLRFVADPNVTIENCYGMTSTDSAGVPVTVDATCSPPLTPDDLEQAATLNKSIAPETVPERIPGSDPADSAATVTLRVQNTGTLTAQFLRITDNDTDFWDAVDFAGFGTITPPATGATLRADLLQIDAFVDDAWVNGIPGPVGSPALPAGVTADEVRGLRFTFSSTLTVNDGYVITPCNEDPTGGCAGVVNFVVEPRLTLVSTGEPLPDSDGDDLPDPLLDTATGAFQTQLTGEPTDIPPVTDDLMFRPGDPALDVGKTPENATVQPGQLATFNLVTSNTGSANLPDLTVSDPLPTGILFDDTFADPDTGEPFTVTWTNLPDGVSAPDDVVFATTPDPDDPSRIGLLRWTFPGFAMPPNSTVTILYRYTLEPGVTAGQEITNTMGASSPVDDLVCSDPNDGVVVDGEFGDGLYCTDPANVTVTAGANFASRKWVAGNPALGWYNEATGQVVPIGGGGCLLLEANGRTYTTNPCIALVNPGEEFYYVLRVQNAGTEDALQMTVYDEFPFEGDTNFNGSTARGTQWSNRPTLAAEAMYSGPATGTIGYTSSADPCIDDLFLDQPPCPADAWDDPAGADTTALRLSASFDPDPLPPGGTVDVSFTMDAPADVAQVSDPTVAYNSLAHAEVTDVGNGEERVLAPLEPLKVGVATMYGAMELRKEIGENPADLPVDEVAYEFTYDCTLTNGSLWSGNATAEVTVDGPVLVEGIPAGSTCEVWETGTNGGIPSATEADPVVVTIAADETAQPVVSPVTITNDFPLGHVELTKTVEGGAHEEFTAGPYLVTVNCTDLGETLPGFPIAVEVFPEEPVGTDLPVGSTCTFTERDVPAGVTVAYDPPNADGTAGEVVVPSEVGASVSVGITNTFTVGSLVIEKEVSGPGVPAFSGGPFVFGVSCDYLATEDVFSIAVVVPGSTDGTPVESEPVTGLPVGAICTVTEIDSAGADIVSQPQTVTIEENDEANVAFVGVNNPFSAGSIAVAKTVDGSAADSDYVAGLTFTIDVRCAVEGTDGALETVLDESVTVEPGGNPVVVAGDDGEPLLVPLGARCWGAEETTIGATAVDIDHDSYENGVEIVADADAGVQQLTLTATNTYDRAELTVSKDVVNEPNPNAMYTFSVMCTIEDADGTVLDAPLLSGESPVSLGGGESTTLDVLVGSTCTVAETAVPDDTTVTIAEQGSHPDDADDSDGTVTVVGRTSVLVTNTSPAAEEPAGGDEPDEGPGGGIRPPVPTAPPFLPGTGAGIALTLLLAGMLTAGGLVLSRRRRP